MKKYFYCANCANYVNTQGIALTYIRRLENKHICDCCEELKIVSEYKKAERDGQA